MCIAYIRAKLQFFFAACQLAGVSFLLLLAQLGLDSVLYDEKVSWLDLGLVVVRGAAAFIVIMSSLTVPRRPDVFYNGNKVDEMRSVSLYSRYTFSWAGRLLGMVFKTGRLEEKDIPVLDSRRRAQELQKSFNQIKESPKLYYQLFLAHWRTMAIQWVLSLIVSFVAFAPQFIMFKILKLLEKQSIGVDIGYEAWSWVILMGLTKVLEAVFQSYLYWYLSKISTYI